MAKKIEDIFPEWKDVYVNERKELSLGTKSFSIIPIFNASTIEILKQYDFVEINGLDYKIVYLSTPNHVYWPTKVTFEIV